VSALGLDSGKHFRRTVPSVACPTERLGEWSTWLGQRASHPDEVFGTCFIFVMCFR
jgi:hypothetical protein